MNVRMMARCALFAAFTAVCAWISIPVPPVRMTLQTFAMALCLLTLGGKWGCRSIGLYLLLGIVGMPVFSGFRGGLGALLDVTGGFLWGFGIGGLVFWLLERKSRVAALAAFQLCCYGCGCGWFCVYTGRCAIAAAILGCVVPYLIPDGIKLGLAWMLAKRLRKRIQ